MTRGNQREIDRARAQARQAKHGKKEGGNHGDRLTQATSDADKMREKQRLADLKKAGKLPEAHDQKKEYDDGFLKQFEHLDVDAEDGQPTESKYEEEKQTEDDAGQASATQQ